MTSDESIMRVAGSLTNDQLIVLVDDAMRFLRTCGTDRGPRQADALNILVTRLQMQENELIMLRGLEKQKRRWKRT